MEPNRENSRKSPEEVNLDFPPLREPLPQIEGEQEQVAAPTQNSAGTTLAPATLTPAEPREHITPLIHKDHTINLDQYGELEDRSPSSSDSESDSGSDSGRDETTLSDHTVKETQLPWGSVLAVSLVLFTNNLNRLIIFPFLPFMVQDFFDGELGDTEIGYYAGYLGSAFSLGGFFGNLIWGSLADRFGRRPIMLVGLSLTIFTVTAFGFSSSFIMAVVVRFCWGLLNGNVGVGKTFLAEVCDDTNQARGFAILGMTGGIARLIGPALGGILVISKSSPLYKVFGHIKFFNEYPYSLPTFVAGGFAIVAFVMCYFWLPETLDEIPGCDGFCSCCNSRKNVRGKSKYEKLREEEEEEEEMGNKAAASDIDFDVHKSNGKTTSEETEENEIDEASLRYMCTDKSILLGICVYASLAFVSNATNEIFPLWVLTPKEEHGFNFEAHHIGLILTFIGIFQVLFQLLFPYITKQFGFLRTLQLGMVVFGLACIGFPFLGFVNDVGLVPGFAMVTIVYLIMVCGRLTSFTCIFVIIANACTPNNRGTVNGVAQSMASVSRTIAPIVAGISFAYSSTNNGKYPLNWMLDWHALALVGFSVVGLVAFLPKELDRKRKKR